MLRDLSLGLGDLLLAGARDLERQLRLGASPVGERGVEREARVGRVDAGDLLSGLHAVALLETKGLEVARDLGGDADLGRLDVARGDDDVVPAAAPACAAGGPSEREHESKHEQRFSCHEPCPSWTLGVSLVGEME